MDSATLSDPGLSVRAFCSTVQNRIDHAKKHLALAEEDLQTIQEGRGTERFAAIKSAHQHCDIVVDDMRGAQLVLDS